MKRSPSLALSVLLLTRCGVDAPVDDVSDTLDHAETTGETADGAADAGTDGGSDADGGVDVDAGVEETTDGSDRPCLDPGPHAADPTVSIGDGTPVLSGATLADGRFELTAVVLYPWTAVNDRVTRFVAEGNDGTGGAVVLRDGAWGLRARLDLYLGLSLATTGGVELDLATTLEVAGPFAAEGGAISTAPGACAVVSTTDCEPGGSLRYEATTDVVAVEILWTKECITSLLPPSYRHYTGMWLTGDVPIVLRFSRATR